MIETRVTGTGALLLCLTDTVETVLNDFTSQCRLLCFYTAQSDITDIIY